MDEWEIKWRKDRLMKVSEIHHKLAGKCFYCINYREKGNEKPVMYCTVNKEKETCDL